MRIRLQQFAVVVLMLLVTLTLTACQVRRDGTPSTTALANENSPSLFEQSVNGFDRCQLGDLFIDEYSQSTSNIYLLANADRQCEITETLVTYCIDEQFHGLRVSQLSVPRSTWPIFAMYFSVPLNEARRTLEAELGSSFPPSKGSRQGIVPELIQDPNDASRSVLICTKPQ